jgi:cytochrome b pre-mRNA-processing protein 3
MFKRLFGRERGNRVVVSTLYREIVAAARQPVFYRDWGVPDTPLGRFEMLGVHAFLVLDRLKDESGPARELAQDLTDHFFGDVESSLREIGIGDMGIPKRMKKLARMFYGRVASYSDALARGDRLALAQALARNVRPDAPSVDAAAEALAGYVVDLRAGLRGQPLETLMQGRIVLRPLESREAAA